MGLVLAYLLGILTAVKAKPKDSGTLEQQSTSPHCQPNPDKPITVVCFPRPLSDQERSQREQEAKRETVKYRVGNISAVVLSLYFLATLLIWWSSRQQTALLRHQLEGTVGAIVEPLTHGFDQSYRETEILKASIDFQNTGNAIAHRAKVSIQGSKRNLPKGDIIGTPLEWSIELGEIPKTPQGGTGVVETFDVPLPKAEIEMLNHGQRTIRLEGWVAYFTGFEIDPGNPTKQPICLEFISSPPSNSTATSPQLNGNFEQCEHR